MRSQKPTTSGTPSSSGGQSHSVLSADVFILTVFVCNLLDIHRHQLPGFLVHLIPSCPRTCLSLLSSSAISSISTGTNSPVSSSISFRPVRGRVYPYCLRLQSPRYPPAPTPRFPR